MPPLATKHIPLTVGLGEIVVPGTLLTALLLAPDGTIALDPGALHGRSELEQSVQIVPAFDQVLNAQVYWIVWVAVELDASETPVRYTGIAVSELWVDPVQKIGYKVLAEHVNRMAEASRGGLNLKTLGAHERALIAKQLASLSPAMWAQTADALKGALA